MTLQQVVQRLQQKNIPTEEGLTFAKLTTFGCGGKIALTVRPTSVRQLIFVAKLLRRSKVPHCFVGNGSNILAADEPYNGVVVATGGVNDIHLHGQFAVASCGASSAKLCSLLCKNGLDGGQFLGCIPATVGGAVVCNAGCFGQSCGQVVHGVLVLHCGRLRRYTNRQCLFQKRNSIFKNNPDFVVLQVCMRFTKASPSQVVGKLAQMRKTKAQTQPLGAPSAGCVLFHPKVAVSRLIDQAGLKGFRIGDAQVAEKHAGFILNLDKATSRDIYLLVQYIKTTLAQQFGITAQVELCLINFQLP